MVALQVRNMALLHGFAWARVDDQAGHAGYAIDAVLAAEWRMVGVLA